MMTVGELVQLCADVQAQGLSVVVLCARRMRDGKRLPCPKMIDRALRVENVGGNYWNWFVSVKIEDVQPFAWRREHSQVIPLGAA
jgi:hypothetical protein